MAKFKQPKMYAVQEQPDDTGDDTVWVSVGGGKPVKEVSEFDGATYWYRLPTEKGHLVSICGEGFRAAFGSDLPERDKVYRIEVGMALLLPKRKAKKKK